MEALKGQESWEQLHPQAGKLSFQVISPIFLNNVILSLRAWIFSRYKTIEKPGTFKIIVTIIKNFKKLIKEMASRTSNRVYISTSNPPSLRAWCLSFHLAFLMFIISWSLRTKKWLPKYKPFLLQ